ncbi:phage tail family protein [Pseudoclavibacter sp. CFCC 11306]|uniref:phage tail family protein n=1 Tax=Pseudoclavibacter sp. CFCC 11306 TaxID=1564493 RepID=UPI001301362F|nr:phage tail family protein [Pseudoclavibacter sp. CFCC 11306]KAB1659014.1 hypothetical protein F8O09_05465 [Pseudoclavibacter sp. CFCC 11306]
MTELYVDDVRISGDMDGKLGHHFVTSDLLNMAPNDTKLSAKTVGHGSWRVRDDDVRRGQRTVGVTGWTMAESLDDMEARITELEQRPEQHVRVRFVGQGRDLYCEGILDVARPDQLNPVQTKWGAKLVCEDPYLYSTAIQTLFLQSQASSRGGLAWGTSGAGLKWPLDWGDGGLDGNSGIVYNAGNAAGGPVITVHGNFPQGVTLMDSLGRSLVFDGPVLSGSPVTFDCRPGRRTVKANGVNKSALLSSREWFTVPAGGDLGISFLPHTTGNGWAEVTMQDVWL